MNDVSIKSKRAASGHGLAWSSLASYGRWTSDGSNNRTVSETLRTDNDVSRSPVSSQPLTPAAAVGPLTGRPQAAGRRSVEVVFVRRDHQHLVRLQAENLRRPEIHFRVRLHIYLQDMLLPAFLRGGVCASEAWVLAL